MGTNQKKATQRQITNFYLNTLLLLLLPRPPPAPPVSHSYKSLHENFTRTEPTLWTEARMRGGCALKSKWESARLLVSGCIVGFFFNFLFGKWWHWSCRQDYERPRHPRDGVRHGGSGGYRAGHDRWGSWWENMVFCNSCLHAIPERGLGLGFILVMLWVLIETAVDILRPRYLRELIFCYSVVEKLLLL